MRFFLDPTRTLTGDRAEMLLGDLLDEVKPIAYARAFRAEFTQGFDAVLQALIANLLLADLLGADDADEEEGEVDGRFVVCPLGNRLNRTSRYKPEGFNSRTLKRALEALERSGYVAVTKGVPNKRGAGQLATTVRATPKLQRRFVGLTIDDLGHLPGAEIVMLRGEPKREWSRMDRDRGELIEYPETDDTRAIRAELRAINQLIGAPGRIRFDGYAEAFGFRINLTNARLRRYFCRGSFASGGRLFGHWAQFVPKKARHCLRIDGRSVVELDFTGMLVDLAYGALGEDMPEGDPYVVPGFGPAFRGGMKRALSALLFLRRPVSDFPRGVRSEEGEDCFGWRITWAEVEAALRQRHPRLASSFCTGVGLVLMRTESDVLLRAMGRLVGEGVPFVPLHDALLVAQGYEALARDAMTDAFAAVVGRYPARPLKATRWGSGGPVEATSTSEATRDPEFTP